MKSESNPNFRFRFLFVFFLLITPLKSDFNFFRQIRPIEKQDREQPGSLKIRSEIIWRKDK